MLVQVYLFVGFGALLATGFAVSTQTRASAWYDEYADPVAMVAGLLGAISWWYLAYGSLNIEVVDGAGGVEAFAMPAITLWCLMVSIVPLYVAFTGPLEVVKQSTRVTAEDL